LMVTALPWEWGAGAGGLVVGAAPGVGAQGRVGGVVVAAVACWGMLGLAQVLQDCSTYVDGWVLSM
jgi:hypothetical protein